MNISFLKMKGSKYVVFILLGLLILVLCVPTGTVQEGTKSEEVNASNGSLEEQLEKVLQEMEGVGSVEVMITTESTSEGVFSSQKESAKVCGVVVVAQGAGSASINAQITDVIKALFSIDVNKISIVKMRSQEDRR